MVSEKKILKVIGNLALCVHMTPWGVASLEPRGLINKIFPIISLWQQMIPGHGQFGPQGLDWQDLCRGPLNIATY